MVNFYDELKQTIIKMMRWKLDVSILESPTQSPIKNKKSSFPKLLFKSYYKGLKKKINVIDYDKYDMYGIKQIPNIEQDIKGMYVIYNRNKYKIVKYSDGLLELETDILNLSEYNDMLTIEECESEVKEKDFIIVTCPYNFNKTLNANTVENYRKFQIDIFIYNDTDENKVAYYTDKIHKIFERDFQILDNKDLKIKGQFAYIYQQLSFDVVEYNITNKIVRGTMLIRTYNR